MIKKYQNIPICLFALLFPLAASSQEVKANNLYDQYRWSGMYYYARTVNEPLVQIFTGKLITYPEHIQSLELAYTLDPDNFLRKFVSPIVSVTQVAGNVTVRYGKNENTIYEFDPYLIFRWVNFPWNNHVNTSLALAEGVSYDTSVPAIEKGQNSNTRRLLNYLMFEATFASPDYPRLQFVARIHHRSGAFGLYRAGNTGSNDVGVGIRYLF